MASKTFHSLIEQMKEIHDKKNEDYASSENPFANFDRAAELMSWFKDDGDKVFVNLIGVKLARLAELLSSGKTPNNESIDDTFIDLGNYVILWASWRIDNRGINKIKVLMDNVINTLPKYKEGEVLPFLEKCTDCRRHVVEGSYVDHCIEMHGALYDKTLGLIKFPDKQLVIIPPGDRNIYRKS